MNYLDIFIIIVIGLGIFWGFSKGLTQSFAGIAGFFTALFVATSMVGVVAVQIQNWWNVNSGASYVIGYIVLFFSVLLAFKFAAHIIKKFLDLTSTRWIDRIAGAVFGFLISALAASFLFTVLSFFSFTDRLLPERENSLFYPYTRDFLPLVINLSSTLNSSSWTFQEISAELLRNKPREALNKSEAGRNLLEYMDDFGKKHGPGRRNR